MPIDVINMIATDAIAAARLPVEDQIPGVRPLDLWRDGPNGAMLFWADTEANLNGLREPVLCDVCVQRTDGAWRAVGAASASSEPREELSAIATWPSSPQWIVCESGVSDVGNRDPRSGDDSSSR